MTTQEHIQEGLRQLNLLGRLQAPLRHSLKFRMIVAFLTISALIGSAVSYLAYREAAGLLQANIADRLTGLSVRRALDVDEWVNRQRSELRFVANTPGVASDAGRLAAERQRGITPTNADRERLRRFLKSGAELAIAADELQVISAVGGEVLASTDPAQVGTYRISDQFFTEGRKGSYMSNVYPSPMTGRPALSISTPLRDSSNRVIAVLAAHLKLQRVEELLEQKSPGFNVDVYLVNRFGEFVSSRRFGRDKFRRGVHSEGIANALAGVDGVGVYENYEGTRVIGAYRWMKNRELALLVEVPEIEAFAPARILLLHVLLVGTLGVLLLTIAVSSVAKRVADPILTTARAARQVAAGDFNAHAPVTTEDEVGLLAASFNEMTARLQTLYRDLHGQVAATQGALDALRENQALVHGLVDNSATVVLAMDLSWRCTLVNTRFVELFALKGEPCEGQLLTSIVPSASASAIIHAATTVVTTTAVVETEIVMGDGQDDRCFLAACFPIHGPDRTVSAVGVIATDITERKRAEEERRAFDANVQHAQKLESLGVMAGGIAHDFNNLLGAVIGNVDIALLSLDNRDDVRQSLDQVLRAARRAADLTRQMLAYAGRGSFHTETVDLNKLVWEISALAGMSLSKKARLELKLSEIPSSIVADSAQVSQVVLNLLTNAGDAIGDNAGRLTVQTEILTTLPPVLAKQWPGDVAQAGPFVVLSVEDTGSGMSAETQERIFEPFFTSKEMGRGLGLAAVLGIVKGLGGALHVQSTLGTGTRFDLAFPASASLAAPNAAARTHVKVEGSVLTIMVVDDELALRLVLRRALGKAGFQVIEAADGHAAIGMFAANAAKIGGVVLDLTMPGMGGDEVLRGIREMDAEMPVLIVSGYAMADESDTLRNDPHVRFLQKPFDTWVLVRTVSEMARRA